MNTVHDQQRIAWEAEHYHPVYLPGLDQPEVSGGVKAFWEYLARVPVKKFPPLKGLEIGCGKGRNAIWLAQQGAWMEAFDFSNSAIKTSIERSQEQGVRRAHFFKHDIIESWPFPDESFDFVIDCFASTDVEGASNRQFMAQEICRTLKKGGYFCLYTNSINSDIYKEFPAINNPDFGPHAYLYREMQKYETVFSQDELDQLYCRLTLKEARVISRISKVKNRSVQWEHLWNVYRKS